MSLKTISNNIAKIITDDLHYNTDDQDIMAYAIEVILMTVSGTILIIAAGYLTGALVPTMAAAISGGTLRRFSGGAHFNTPLKCLIFGAVVYALLGVLARAGVSYHLVNQHVLLIIFAVASLPVIIFAPVDSKAKPIHSMTLRLKLKIFSLGFIIFTTGAVYFNGHMLINAGAALGTFYQSVTLLPYLNRRRWDN